MTSGDEEDGVPGSRPWWRIGHRRLMTVPSALALAGLVAGVTYVTTGGGSVRPGATASPHPASAKPAPQFQMPAPVVPVALPSTGAIPLPTGHQPRVAAWNSGPGGSALKTLSSQAGAAATGRNQYGRLRSACWRLAVGVAAALAAPAIPDAAMQKLYQKALSALASAARRCRAATSEQPGSHDVVTTEGANALTAVESAIASAYRELSEAAAQIAAFGHDQ
jgi:hypothetical protein